MIKAENGNIEIKGNGAELLADYSCITEALFETMMEDGMTEEEAKSYINTAMERGLKSIDELIDEISSETLKLVVAELLSEWRDGK